MVRTKQAVQKEGGDTVAKQTISEQTGTLWAAGNGLDKHNS